MDGMLIYEEKVRETVLSTGLKFQRKRESGPNPLHGELYTQSLFLSRDNRFHLCVRLTPIDSTAAMYDTLNDKAIDVKSFDNIVRLCGWIKRTVKKAMAEY